MNEPNGLDRWALLAGGAAVAPITLAGCLDLSAGDGSDEPALPEELDYAGWMDGANGYASTVDRREQGRTVVEVGAASGFAGQFQRGFAPAAIAVSPGPTVLWHWRGSVEHDVIPQDGDGYQSPLHEGSGASFEYTFENRGVHTYFYAPYLNDGMREAVFVTGGS